MVLAGDPKRSFGEVRSQTEFGNEFENHRPECDRRFEVGSDLLIVDVPCRDGPPALVHSLANSRSSTTQATAHQRVTSFSQFANARGRFANSAPPLGARREMPARDPAPFFLQRLRPGLRPRRGARRDCLNRQKGCKIERAWILSRPFFFAQRVSVMPKSRLSIFHLVFGSCPLVF